MIRVFRHCLVEPYMTALAQTHLSCKYVHYIEMEEGSDQKLDALVWANPELFFFLGGGGGGGGLDTTAATPGKSLVAIDFLRNTDADPSRT